MNSFIAWVGSKRLLRGRIVPLIPEHSCYCEPFMGAAWVFFGKDPAASRIEVLNDVNSDLVNLFLVVKYHPDEFLRELSFAVPSRKMWERFRGDRGLTDIQKAARFFYFLKNCYGGKLDPPTFGKRRGSKPAFNPETAIALVEAASKRLARVIVEELDFADCIAAYDAAGTVFFCDPPYFGTTTPYLVDFGGEEHEKLAEVLARIEGRFILTIDDRREVRKLYEWATVRPVTSEYRIRPGRKTSGGQLIVTNFEPEEEKMMKTRTKRKAGLGAAVLAEAEN